MINFTHLLATNGKKDGHPRSNQRFMFNSEQLSLIVRALESHRVRLSQFVAAIDTQRSTIEEPIHVQFYSDIEEAQVLINKINNFVQDYD
jgi:hypothetical protein